ncbi:hypothetical protein SCLARK_001241 [Spiroplasma clarkii]|uniref:hypothetical protein n=1 Tax=Spiroplasma clarkii TaxID=2139 RepID=UPI000B54A83F|nr:hypothetical protein [Spiroplasma clarkii]ARU91791.1 hypothetical protein SCLARK_001241 [Spiroplasma clarkii]
MKKIRKYRRNKELIIKYNTLKIDEKEEEIELLKRENQINTNLIRVVGHSSKENTDVISERISSYWKDELFFDYEIPKEDLEYINSESNLEVIRQLLNYYVWKLFKEIELKDSESKKIRNSIIGYSFEILLKSELDDKTCPICSTQLESLREMLATKTKEFNVGKSKIFELFKNKSVIFSEESFKKFYELYLYLKNREDLLIGLAISECNLEKLKFICDNSKK